MTKSNGASRNTTPTNPGGCLLSTTTTAENGGHTATEMLEAVQAASATEATAEIADLDRLNLQDLDNLDFEPSPIFANAMYDTTTAGAVPTSTSTAAVALNEQQLQDYQQQQQQQQQQHHLQNQHIPAILDQQQQQPTVFWQFSAAAAAATAAQDQPQAGDCGKPDFPAFEPEPSRQTTTTISDAAGVANNNDVVKTEAVGIKLEPDLPHLDQLVQTQCNNSPAANPQHKIKVI